MNLPTNRAGQSPRPDQQQAARTTVLRALARMYGFSDADVRANRQGRLSESQQGRIHKRHLENSRYAWIGFAIVAVLGFLGSGGAALSEGRPLPQMWAGVGLALSVVALAVWIGIQVSRWKMRRTLRDGAVHQVHGVVRLRVVRAKPPRYYLNANGVEFDMTSFDHHKLHQAGVDGVSGRVYYTRGWRTVLSVELDP